MLGRMRNPGQGWGGLGYLSSQTWLQWAPSMKIFEGLAKDFEFDPSVVNREPLKVSKWNGGRQPCHRHMGQHYHLLSFAYLCRGLSPPSPFCSPSRRFSHSHSF